jgi:hypothetical protein
VYAFVLGVSNTKHHILVYFPSLSPDAVCCRWLNPSWISNFLSTHALVWLCTWASYSSFGWCESPHTLSVESMPIENKCFNPNENKSWWNFGMDLSWKPWNERFMLGSGCPNKKGRKIKIMSCPHLLVLGITNKQLPPIWDNFMFVFSQQTFETPIHYI